METFLFDERWIFGVDQSLFNGPPVMDNEDSPRLVTVLRLIIGLLIDLLTCLFFLPGLGDLEKRIKLLYLAATCFLHSRVFLKLGSYS